MQFNNELLNKPLRGVRIISSVAFYTQTEVVGYVSRVVSIFVSPFQIFRYSTAFTLLRSTIRLSQKRVNVLIASRLYFISSVVSTAMIDIPTLFAAGVSVRTQPLATIKALGFSAFPKHVVLTAKNLRLMSIFTLSTTKLTQRKLFGRNTTLTRHRSLVNATAKFTYFLTSFNFPHIPYCNIVKLHTV